MPKISNVSGAMRMENGSPKPLGDADRTFAGLSWETVKHSEKAENGARRAVERIPGVFGPN